MEKKKIIIISSIILALIIIIVIIMSGSNKKEKKEETKININLEKSYLSILNDTNNMENMTNTKVQLCDIDKNSVPELIIYGITETKEYIIDIYKINDKNNNIKTSITSKNLTDMILLYDFTKDDYIWHGVEKNISEYNLHELNIDLGETTKKTTLNNYDNEYYEITGNYSGKVDFNKEDSEEQKEKTLELAKERYVQTDLMITDIVKKEIELAKKIKNLNKIDSSKGIVYSALEYGDYKYPIININSENVQKINSEIKNKYGFTETDAKSKQLSLKGIEQITYDYYINDNILSVVVKKGGNSSTNVNSYNIDILSSEKTNNTNIIENKGFSTSDVIEQITQEANKEFESSIQNFKSNMSQYWNTTYGKEEATWKEELNTSVKNLDNIYINKNGELCSIVEFKQPGAKWTCTKAIEINISKGYLVSYITYQKSTVQNNNIESANNVEDNSVEQNQDLNENIENQNPTTEGAISKEEAQILAENVWGIKSKATGYKISYSYIAWIRDEEGREYYLFNVKWFADSHWSWIGTLFISVDGTEYKQGDVPLVSVSNGQTVKGMLEGGVFENR